jgi:hypothetical protein
MAIRKKTLTVADTPVDAGWKRESVSTHRKYPATRSQVTVFDGALFMMTSRQALHLFDRCVQNTAAKVCSLEEAEIFCSV